MPWNIKFLVTLKARKHSDMTDLNLDNRKKKEKKKNRALHTLFSGKVKEAVEHQIYTIGCARNIA